MKKKTVYVETSIVSYLTARPSNSLMAAAWQRATIEWWETQRNRFSLYVSDIVIEEASRGDVSAAARRLDVLRKIPILEINNAAVAMSKELIDQGALPKKALDDSLHIAVSCVQGIDYLASFIYRFTL